MESLSKTNRTERDKRDWGCRFVKSRVKDSESCLVCYHSSFNKRCRQWTAPHIPEREPLFNRVNECVMSIIVLVWLIGLQTLI